MKFGSALEGLKSGNRVRRTTWIVPEMHLVMFRTEGQLGEYLRVPVIGIFTAQGHYKPWGVTQDDVIEEDWELC